MSEGIKDVSWRTICGVFASQAKSRFAWDRTHGTFRRLVPGDGHWDTHWQACRFESHIQPIWLTSFATEFVNALLKRPNDPASQKLLDMTAGTAWTDHATIRLLKEYCKAAWGRDFEPKPRHLLNLPNLVMDMATDEAMPRPEGHDWTWVLDAPPMHEWVPEWVEFLDRVLAKEAKQQLQLVLGAALVGGIQGQCCYLSGRDVFGKQMVVQALGMSLGPLCTHLTDADTAGKRLPSATRDRIAQGTARIVLLPHGMDGLDGSQATWGAITDQGQVLPLIVNDTFPFIHSVGSLVSIPFEADTSETSAPKFQGHFRRHLATLKFRQQVAWWLLDGAKESMQAGARMQVAGVPATGQGSLLD